MRTVRQILLHWFRFSSSAWAAFILLFSASGIKNAAAETRFGLWVESEGVVRAFDSPHDVERVIKFTENEALTDLYCQVYRDGRSWFPSIMADDTPYRLAREGGVDPLRQIIDTAHKRGQRVHGWLNALRILKNRDAPLLKVIGEEAIQVDSFGNSLLRYNEQGRGPSNVPSAYVLGTPGLWLDPASAQVRNYLVETVRDLIAAYPDIDGIHLDMVRFPYLIRRPGAPSTNAFRPRVGYSPLSLQRFFEFSGEPQPPLTPALVRTLEGGGAWATWRRAQVTLLVFQIKELINSLAPDMEFSVAGLGAGERAYRDAFQDWPEWMRGRLVDSVVTMSYNRDTKAVRSQSLAAVRARTSNDVIVGLGAWLLESDTPKLVQQGKEALAAGADGVALFSYANLAKNRSGEATLRQFSNSVFPSLEKVVND